MTPPVIRAFSRCITSVCVVAALLFVPGLAASGSAETISIPIGYLGSGSTGNGYKTAFPGYLLDAFSMDNAHSYLQVDISGLTGQTITSAVLSFRIGGDIDRTIVVTSFDSGGTLGLHFTPPNVIATQNFVVNGGGGAGGNPTTFNALDVTSLLTQRTTAGANYFALHFAPLDPNDSNLYVQPANAGGGPDLKLDVTTVPEPASMLLLGTGLAGLVARRMRRRQ